MKASKQFRSLLREYLDEVFFKNQNKDFIMIEDLVKMAEKCYNNKP